MNKIKKLKENKVFKFLLVTVMLVMMCPILVYADESTDAITKLGNLFSGIIKVAGFIVAGYGFSILGPGVSQHDASQIRTGLLVIVGGVIMYFHVKILGEMGITI